MPGRKRVRRLLHRALKLLRHLVSAMLSPSPPPPPSSPSPCPVNDRVGHVAASAGGDDGRLILWGGYRETRGHHPHLYWPTDRVHVYCPRAVKWREVATKGRPPPKTSGAAACVMEGQLFVLCGFIRELATVEQEEGDDEDGEPLLFEYEANTNEIYSLDLDTWEWTKREPKGDPPMLCDKLACWTHGGKIYIFGGFGPDCARGNPEVSFVLDNALPQAGRGWNNQLVAYDPSEDAFSWPSCVGEVPPPRAAHAVVCSPENGVFLFGGRLEGSRMNDLFHLDLEELRWRRLKPRQGRTIPCGRSWHSLTVASPSLAVLYGGYNTEKKPLKDCWTLDLTNPQDSTKARWSPCKHLESGRRLWHQAVREAVTGQVWVLGGVMDDLLDHSLHRIRHPSRVARLTVTPLPLVQLALGSVLAIQSSGGGEVTSADITMLPECVKSLIPLCKSDGA